MDIERVKKLVDTLKEDHLARVNSDPEEAATEKLWKELEHQLKGVGKHWAFHVEKASNHQILSGNIADAFKEFFEAHQEWERNQPKEYHHLDVERNPEPGTKEKPFEASNGIKIRYR